MPDPLVKKTTTSNMSLSFSIVQQQKAINKPAMLFSTLKIVMMGA